jgi:hypothetical protein
LRDISDKGTKPDIPTAKSSQASALLRFASENQQGAMKKRGCEKNPKKGASKNYHWIAPLCLV